ncbi:MAG TPA: putative metallopeptidase [Spirochaetota bacterium]|nr:putative metallopeptidase [Spirochaetota bacterium]HNT12354.1 putative metallopeptidase [Spirochaetota bacterium]
MAGAPAPARLRTIDLTGELESIIRDICACVPMFAHIDMGRVLVCVASNRGNGGGGCYGKLVPLRFAGGAEIARFRGRSFAIPRVVAGERRMLYVIYFYFPRFFDLDARGKLRVIFHELYHISPDFNGDIRRMGPVRAAHGHSRRRFDRRFEAECDGYFDRIRSTGVAEMLSLDGDGLHGRFKRVLGRRLKVPRPVEVGSREDL